MAGKVFGQRECRLKVSHIRAGAGVRTAVVDDGSAKRGDVLVVEGGVPHHDFVDFSLKVGAASPVDAQLVHVNVGERTVWIGVGIDQNPVHVLANIAVVKHAHEMRPSLCNDIAKGLGGVVMQHPFLAGDHVLEGEVGPCLVVNGKGRGVGRLVGGVGPNPLTYRQVSSPVVDVDFGLIVHTIKPQTGTINTGLPIGVVHAVQREVGASVDAVVGCRS